LKKVLAACGFVALVLAITTGAFAAKKVLITGSDIKNGSVTGVDVKNGSLGTGELSSAARNALSGRDGADGAAGPQGPAGATGATGPAGPKGDTGAAGASGSVGAKGDTGATGATGPKGETGPKGDKGDKGDRGEPGLSGYKIFSTVQSFGPGGIGGAWCGAPDANATTQGWVVVGGGAELTDDQIRAGVAVASSWPNPDATHGGLNPGWNIRMNAPPNVSPGDVTVYAVCVKAAS